jgi:hypothetical protein
MATCEDSSPSVGELWPDVDKLDDPSREDTSVPLCMCVMLRFTGRGWPWQLRTLISVLGTKATWIHCQMLLECLILDQKGAKVDPRGGISVDLVCCP